jgi:hypothetical protein
MRMCDIYHTPCQLKSESKNVRNAEFCGSSWLSRQKLASADFIACTAAAVVICGRLFTLAALIAEPSPGLS